MFSVPIREHEAIRGDELLREVLEDLGACVCEVEADTLKVISVSGQAEMILGYPVDAWIADPDFFETHLHPDDRIDVLSRLRLEVTPGRRCSFEFRMLEADRRLVWLKASARMDPEGSGLIRMVLADITRHKRAEEALRESKRRYKYFVDHARDIIYKTDLRGRITFFNNSAPKVLRFPAEELLGRNYLEFIRPDFRRTVRRFYWRQFQSRGKTSYFEMPVVTAEGTCVWLGQNVQLVMDHGEIVGFQGIARDLTEQKRAEERLRESEERYRIVAETATDAIITFDGHGDIVFVNHASEKLFGYTVEEMIGRPITLLLPECPRRFLQSFAWVDLSTGQSYLGTETERLSGTHRNGAVLILEATIGEFTQFGRHQFTAVIRDITEKQRIEDAIRRSELRFRSLIENASDLIVILDEAGCVQYASPSVERILDVRAEEIFGKTAFEFIHPDDRDWVRETFSFQLEHGSSAPQRFDCRMRRRDGSWRVMEAIGRNLLEDAAVRGYVCNLRDITDRKKAQDDLRQANETLRTLIQTSPLAIIAFDRGSMITKWNSAAERMFGWNEDEVLATRPPFIPEDRVEEAGELFNTLAQGRSFAVSTIRQRRDGSLVPVSISAAPIHGPSGTFAGAVAILTDETERRRLEDQLRQAQKMEAVGQLAGGIAHDFNNLLTVITGYDQLLLSCLDNQDRPGIYAREIMQAAERASSLTRQLLAFSRRQNAQPRFVDLNALIANMAPMLSRLAGDSVEITHCLADDTATIHADPVQIEQIVLNLVVNARDAMPSGGRLTIETRNVILSAGYSRAHVSATPGPHVLLAVTDTGVGMDAETRERVFEPFFTTKELGKGTGLGLSTVYGIVQQNHGQIWVYSEPGVGSSFKVYLPAVAAPAPPSAVEEPMPFTGGDEAILLVENDPNLRELVGQLLSTLGYQVIAVRDAMEAEAVCSDASILIHLLVTDLVLPDVGGRDLVERLMALRPGLRTLYMSGYPDEAVIHNGLIERGAPFLQKPFSQEALGAKVREVLDAAAPSSRA
ncbi:MAG: PAS domain S-box protein [Bryobacteraceae bacterium]